MGQGSLQPNQTGIPKNACRPSEGSKLPVKFAAGKGEEENGAVERPLTYHTQTLCNDLERGLCWGVRATAD